MPAGCAKIATLELQRSLQLSSLRVYTLHLEIRSLHVECSCPDLVDRQLRVEKRTGKQDVIDIVT